MTKQIWLPNSELKVTISQGVVRVWDEMTMYQRPVASEPAGFKDRPREDKENA